MTTRLFLSPKTLIGRCFNQWDLFFSVYNPVRLYLHFIQTMSLEECQTKSFGMNLLLHAIFEFCTAKRLFKIYFALFSFLLLKTFLSLFFSQDLCHLATRMTWQTAFKSRQSDVGQTFFFKSFYFEMLRENFPLPNIYCHKLVRIAQQRFHEYLNQRWSRAQTSMKLRACFALHVCWWQILCGKNLRWKCVFYITTSIKITLEQVTSPPTPSHWSILCLVSTGASSQWRNKACWRVALLCFL